jgi:hypothetical protein
LIARVTDRLLLELGKKDDALEFKHPVLSKYNHDLLETIIRYRLRKGHGSREMFLGSQKFIKARKSNDILTKGVSMLSGTEVKMAIVIPDLLPHRIISPIHTERWINRCPECIWEETVPYPGDGHTW